MKKYTTKEKCRHPENRIKPMKEKDPKTGVRDARCFDCGEIVGQVVPVGLGMAVLRENQPIQVDP